MNIRNRPIHFQRFLEKFRYQTWPAYCILCGHMKVNILIKSGRNVELNLHQSLFHCNMTLNGRNRFCIEMMEKDGICSSLSGMLKDSVCQIEFPDKNRRHAFLEGMIVQGERVVLRGRTDSEGGWK